MQLKKKKKQKRIESIKRTRDVMKKYPDNVNNIYINKKIAKHR